MTNKDNTLEITPEFKEEFPVLTEVIKTEQEKYNEALTRFVLAEKLLENAKLIYKNYDEAIEELVKLKGLDFYFQLPDGPVVKLQEAKGRYVEYERIEAIRTKREGEAKGSLSVKEAIEKGFKI